MTNGESTYIGMSLPEGIRYITVFEKGDFENCGRILRTFYSTEDRVKKLLALGNRFHLEGRKPVIKRKQEKLLAFE